MCVFFGIIGKYDSEVEAAKAVDQYVVEHNLDRSLNFPLDYPNYKPKDQSGNTSNKKRKLNNVQADIEMAGNSQEKSNKKKRKENEPLSRSNGSASSSTSSDLSLANNPKSSNPKSSSSSSASSLLSSKSKTKLNKDITKSNHDSNNPSKTITKQPSNPSNPNNALSVSDKSDKAERAAKSKANKVKKGWGRKSNSKIINPNNPKTPVQSARIPKTKASKTSSTSLSSLSQTSNVQSDLAGNDNIGELRQSVPDEFRCCARVWGDGTGSHRCTFKKSGHDHFCKVHAKKSAVTETPCQTDDEGKRLGLFMGRFDQWQDGKKGVLPFKDQHGFVRIDWTSDAMRATVKQQLKDGTAKRPAYGMGSAAKPKKKGVSQGMKTSTSGTRCGNNS